MSTPTKKTDKISQMVVVNVEMTLILHKDTRRIKDWIYDVMEDRLADGEFVDVVEVTQYPYEETTDA